MGNTFYFEWEVALMEAIQAHLGDIGAKIASIVSVFGEEMFLVLLLGFVYWCWDKKAGRIIGLNIVMGVTYNPLLKNMALRRRPYMDNPTIQCLKPVDKSASIYDIKVQGYSFPSGHSTNSTIAFGSIAYFFKNKVVRTICIVLPLLVGISRFCLGVHYPTDVLVGWILGVCIVFLMPWLLKRFPNKKKLYPVIFVISCVGWFFCTTNDYYTGLGMMGGFFIADIFEEKYVKFENTRSVISCIIRVVVGAGLFLGLNTVLKMPFPSAVLNAENALAYLIRTLRYAVIIFIEVGLYPMCFKWLKGLDKKTEKKAQ